eukprot:1655017-Rhodomonas_salina.3
MEVHLFAAPGVRACVLSCLDSGVRAAGPNVLLGREGGRAAKLRGWQREEKRGHTTASECSDLMRRHRRD